MSAVLPPTFLARVAVLAGLIAFMTGITACSASGGGDEVTLANMPADLAVDPYLWEGTLETLRFMPITRQVPSAGTIETGWKSLSGDPNEQVRAVVQIKPGPVTHSSVQVTVYRQVGGKPAAVDPTTGPTVQESILLRARQIKTSIQVD